MEVLMYVRRGFLDSLSDEDMDRLDDVVFESEYSFPCRRESLLFMIEHTDGFDVKGKSSEKSVLPLELLAEFIEHHIIPESKTTKNARKANSDAYFYKELMNMCGLLVEVASDVPQCGKNCLTYYALRCRSAS